MFARQGGEIGTLLAGAFRQLARLFQGGPLGIGITAVGLDQDVRGQALLERAETGKLALVAGAQLVLGGVKSGSMSASTSRTPP